jgi:hypothetical protein
LIIHRKFTTKPIIQKPPVNNPNDSFTRFLTIDRNEEVASVLNSVFGKPRPLFHPLSLIMELFADLLVNKRPLVHKANNQTAAFEARTATDNTKTSQY